MNEDNKAMLGRWFVEVWNKKAESAIDEMISDETVHHGLTGPDGPPVRGVEEFKQFHRAFVDAFPDIEVVVEDMIAEGDKVAARCTVTGTHRGAGLGFAPTDRSFRFTGTGICRVRDGRFVEVWNEFDFLSLYSQLGRVAFTK